MTIINGDRLAESIKMKAKAAGKNVDDILRRYALERFTSRLHAFEGSHPLVLKMLVKGGMLWHWDTSMNDHSRPTSDIDMHVFGDHNHDEIIDLFNAAASLEDVEDGIAFSIGRIRKLEHSHYEEEGLRIMIIGHLGRTRINVHADLGIGGLAPAGITTMKISPIITGMSTCTVRCQPWTYVIAEKLHAVVDKGMVNTRMKDFRDLNILASKDVNMEAVVDAIKHTFNERDTAIPSSEVDGLSDDFAVNKQNEWENFLRNSLLTDRAPSSFIDVVHNIKQFAEPIFEQINNGNTLKGMNK